MKAVIRSLMSLDVDDLDGWAPASEVWALGLRVFAGPDGGPGEECFDITVCSLAWLTERVHCGGVFDGRHHLVLESYDWPMVRTYVMQRVRRCEGATWRDVAEQLARIGYWEFEDYRP